MYKMADCCRPEVARDIIYGKIAESVGVNLCIDFGDPRASGSFSAKTFFFKMATAAERK